MKQANKKLAGVNRKKHPPIALADWLSALCGVIGVMYMSRLKLILGFILLLLLAPQFVLAQAANIKPDGNANVAAKSDTATKANDAESAPTITPPVRPPIIIEPIFSLERILRDDPALKSASERICQAYFVKLQSRSPYYPRLDMSLQGGDKLIDETTRADEYGGSNSPEYDGHGLNATLSFRQQVYDWGRTRAAIDGAQSQEEVARLERVATMDERLALFLNMAFQYVLQDQLLLHLEDSYKKVEVHLKSVEARYRAGASRLSEVRQARLILLNFDGQIDEANRQRGQVVHNLKAQFGTTADDAAIAVADFRKNRPDVPEIVPPENALQARILRQNIAQTNADMRRLRAERLPAIEGTLTARGWDIEESQKCNDPVNSRHPDAGSRRVPSANRIPGDDRILYRDQNCSTHEVTGALQFSVPLYDGGANRAERRSIAARLRGLQNSLLAAQRAHESESRRLQDELLGLLRQVTDTETEVSELEKEVDSELSRQRATRADPLALMQIRQRLSEAQARYIVLIMRAEAARMQGLAQAGNLAHTLDITLGADGC